MQPKVRLREGKWRESVQKRKKSEKEGERGRVEEKHLSEKEGERE